MEKDKEINIQILPALSNNDNLHILSIDSVNIKNKIDLSSIFKKVNHIILENTEEALLGRISQLEIYEDKIFILDAVIAKALFMFNKEGKFIGKIGRLGQGPGEYISPSSFSINKEKNELYLYDFDQQKINKYDLLSNKFIKSVRFSNNIRSRFIVYNKGEVFADAYFSKKTGKEYLLRSLDTCDFKQTKLWLKSSEYNKGWSEMYFAGNQTFYHTEKGLNYTQLFMDTVMALDGNNIKPYLCFKSDNLLTQKDFDNLKLNTNNLNSQLIKSNKIWNINSFIEYKNIIAFRYKHKNTLNHLFYNTENKEIRIAYDVNDDLTFPNNTDYAPTPYFIYSTNKGIYAYIHPMEMPDYIDFIKKKFPSLSINNKLKSLTLDSNPIILYYE